MKAGKNRAQKLLIIHIHSFFPLLPWANHMAKKWISILDIGLRRPLFFLLSDPSKDNSTTVHQAHTVAQITMKTLINRSVLDVGQVCAKMDHKSPNTARS